MLMVDVAAYQQSPRVSVLVNCFNGEKYLAEAIESVISQTYVDWELIFWDNQSTDRSSEILNSYVDSRIKYFRSDKHTSLGEARVESLKRATGSYIAIIDADDVWMHDKLEHQIRFMESNSDVVLLGAWAKRINEFSVEIGELTGPEKNAEVIQRLGTNNPFVNSTVLFDRNAASSIGGYNSDFRSSQDYDLWIRLSEVGRLHILPKFLSKVRIHSRQLSSRRISIDISRDGFLLLKKARTILPLDKKTLKENHDELSRFGVLYGMALVSNGKVLIGIWKIFVGILRSPGAFLKPRNLLKVKRYVLGR